MILVLFHSTILLFTRLRYRGDLLLFFLFRVVVKFALLFLSVLMNMGMSVSHGFSQTYERNASHAGSWYDEDPTRLRNTLEEYMRQAEIESVNQVRGLIVPHAGYRYSGLTAAFSYKTLQECLSQKNNSIRTILVLHPSHHVYSQGCAVSGASSLNSPLGNLVVDDDLRREILSLNNPTFSVMEQRVDESEHSGEMQYPYLAHVISNRDIKVLPIMCGALEDMQEKLYGEALAEIIARPEVCTIISSDFCHWGRRFSYQPTTSLMPLRQFIEQMDRRGLDLIQMKDPGAFALYLKETRNTICGRHPIAVWLNAISKLGVNNLEVRLLNYAQSSAVKSSQESSVSYAAAVAFLEE